MIAIIARVASLRIVPTGGGSFCLADPRTAPVMSQIRLASPVTGTSPVTGISPVNGVTSAGLGARLSPREAGGDGLRAAQRRVPDYLRYVAHARSFRPLNEAISIARVTG
jgi:hypothetical protein